MKDDNILLEALKEIRDYEPKIKMSGERAISIMHKIATAAIQKYSLDISPSDESKYLLVEALMDIMNKPEDARKIADEALSKIEPDENNQDELWNEVATELEKVEFGSDWLFIKGVLKSQYSITRR